MAWHREVFSSHINWVAYTDAGEFQVGWKSGRVSAYSNVPESVAERVSTAWSVGSAVNEEIKQGGYTHRYLV